MPRIKKVPTLSHAKATVMKKLASAASKAKALALKPGQDGLVHTGKLKVPFRPATAASVAKAKKGLIKQLKRRWVDPQAPAADC